MSHFSVLVAIPEGKTLEQVMLPYHEYECTGIEEYLQFVPCDQEELLKDFEKNGEGRPLVQFAKDWGGYSFDPETQKWGRMTNPNKQWDWYEIGGRYSGALPRTTGTKKQIDFEFARNKRLTRSLAAWNNFQDAHQHAEPTPAEIEKARETLAGHWKNYAPAQEFYKDPINLAKDSIAFRAIDDPMWGVSDAKDMHLSQEDYVARFGWQALTFGFIPLDGTWHERGNMGWWGATLNENAATYDGQEGDFWKFVNSLPDDTQLALVDCHI